MPLRRKDPHTPDLSSKRLKSLIAECEKLGGNRIGPLDWSVYWIAKEILGLREKVEGLQKRLDRRKAP